MISFQATNHFFFHCLTEVSTHRIFLKASTAGSLECRPFSLSQRPEVRRISTFYFFFLTNDSDGVPDCAVCITLHGVFYVTRHQIFGSKTQNRIKDH